MPPNNKLEDIVQVALPYVQPAYKLEPQSDEPPVYYQASSSSQELADEEEEEPVFRVTTRARLTYELDRFHKNEMLIINKNKAEVGKTLYLMHTFQRFKFEFTVIDTEAVGDELWQKIDQFFQKDFTNTGLAAVVTDISTPDPDDLTAMADRVQEWDVLNYFMSNQPPTLQEKPKIFISEVPSELSNFPQMTSFPTDTLIIQTQKVFYTHNASASPLDLLCCKLMKMEDTRNILDVLTDVKNHWLQAFFPSHNTAPVKFLSTLTKELLLEKEANTDKEWIKKVYTTVLEPDMLHLYQQVSNTYQNDSIVADESGNSNVVDLDLMWLQDVLDFVSRIFLDRYNEAYEFHSFIMPGRPGKLRVRNQPHLVHPPEVYERIRNYTNWIH